MKRLFAILGAVALAAALGGPVGAGSGFTLTGGYSDIQTPVEQQSPNYIACSPPFPTEPCDPSLWVTNPTGCPWDADDVVIQGGMGTVNSISGVGNCAVADGYWHKHVYASVTAPTAGLIVILTNSQGRSWTLGPVPDGRDYRWSICLRDPTGSGNPPDWYPLIPESNAGRGIQTEYTLTISPTGHSVRNVNAGLWVHGTYTPYPNPC